VSNLEVFHSFCLTFIISLEDLNKRIGNKTLGMERFRPNIVISDAAPWEEDAFKVIKIGDLEFSAKKACARCKMTTIDQSTGTFDGKEPLQTMEDFRKQRGIASEKEVGLMFGKNLIQIKNNSSKTSISVGDAVEVVESLDTSLLQLPTK